MSDPENPTANQGDFPGPGEESLVRLLRLSGPRPEVPEERRSRVRAAAHAQWRATIALRPPRRFGPRLYAALAAAALLVAVGLVARRLLPPSPAAGPAATLLRQEGDVAWPESRSFQIGEAVPSGTGVRTGVDGRVAFRLAGGASIRLDRTTRVRLISGYVLDLEEGALYFDGGSGSAIEIRTPFGAVRDTGTRFEVRLGQDGIRVSVRQGAVTVSHRGRDFPAEAGTRLSIDPAGSVISDAVAPGGEDWDWVQSITPHFNLDGVTLAHYLDWLAGETGWEVRFPAPDIERESERVVLHGSVAGLRPDQTPAVVLPTCGLTSRVEDGVLVLEKAPGAVSPR